MKKEKTREQYGKLASIVGIFANIFLASCKIIVGLLFGFISVLADGLNNLSDCGSSTLSLVSFKLSSKPADKEHPYGHERIEYIFSMIVSFLILMIAFELLKESILKIIKPTTVEFSIIVILTLCLSIFVKFCLFLFNGKLAKKINSDLLKATSYDSISDCISTTAVLVSIIIGKIFGINIDGYVGVAVAIFIAWSGIKIFIETTSKLIGQAPEKELIDSIKSRILANQDVLGIHDLNVYCYGPNKYFASVHIELDAKEDVLKSHEIVDEIEREFLNETNIILTGHLDPIVTDDEEVNTMRAVVNEFVKNIDKNFSMHDFRMVKAEKFTNIIFEVAIPFDAKLKGAEIIDLLKIEIEKYNPIYRPVIMVEKQSF